MRVAIPADGVGAITLKVFTYSTASGKMRCDLVAEQEISNAKKGLERRNIYQYLILSIQQVEGIMLVLLIHRRKATTPECYPISLQKEGTIEKVYAMMEGGQDLYEFGSEKYGNLAIQAVVEKDYPAKDIMLHSVTYNKFTKASNNTKFTLNISNYGTTPINSYTVTATVDGNQIKEQTVNGTVEW